MTILSDILKPFIYLYKLVAKGVKVQAPAAIVITEAIKTILANPVAGFLESIIDSVTGTQIAVDAANEINSIIPKILAAELAIEGLPDSPTQADILAFEQRVMAAFNIKSDNSRLYTVLGAQIYGILNTTAQSGKPITFAILVADVEAAYEDYKADLAANIVPAIPADSSAVNAGTLPTNEPLKLVAKDT